MLDKVLSNYNLYELVPVSRDSVINYAYSIVDTQDLIDNNKSRLERQTKKSPAIVELIEKLEQNKMEKTIIHAITIKDNHVVFVFTDLDNEKIIYVLKPGI